jgi:hypothetical protein
MIVGAFLAYAVMIIIGLACLMVETTVVITGMFLTAHIKSIALRYLCRAVLIAAAFVPTFVPYDGEALLSIHSLSDFVPSIGVVYGPSIDRIRLASYVLVKGLLTGKGYLVYAGGAPIFLAVTTIWCCSMLLKHLWPILSFTVGAFASLFGSTWFHEAERHVHRINFDAFAVALLVWGGGLVLCIVSVIQIIIAATGARRRATTPLHGPMTAR